MAGCAPCIKALLRSPASGASTDSADAAVCKRRSSALVEAVKVNSETSVRTLLGPVSASSAASVDGLADESGLESALIEAVKARACDCIAPLVEAGAVLNPAVDAPGYSCRKIPLIKAVGGKGTSNTGDKAPDIVRLLVKLGAEVNAQRSSDGRSALHVSASKGRCSCMQMLLELGADPTTVDKRGNSPLHLAASFHHFEACQLLVKHITEASGAAAAVAALMAKDTKDRSPLHSAVSADFWLSTPEVTSCVSTLVELLEASGGPQAVEGALREKVGDKGRTVLHSAAGNRHAECLRALTETPDGLRVALDVKDDDGTTPIALAQQAGHDFGDIPAFAQVPFVPCCSGLTEAAEKGHVACVRHFLRDGCPTMGEDGSVDGEDLLDPLASSISHHSHKCSEIVRLLLEAGFHPDGRDGDCFPLRRAADVGFRGSEGMCFECTRLLIEAGAGGLFVRWTQYGDVVMWSILNSASLYVDNDEAIQLAKAALAACDIKNDRHGVTDLCNWAGGCNTELPRLLADAGADVNARNTFGQTVLHMAAGLLEWDVSGDCDACDPRDSDQHVDLVEWLVSKVAALFRHK